MRLALPSPTRTAASGGDRAVLVLGLLALLAIMLSGWLAVLLPDPQRLAGAARPNPDREADYNQEPNSIHFAPVNPTALASAVVSDLATPMPLPVGILQPDQPGVGPTMAAVIAPAPTVVVAVPAVNTVPPARSAGVAQVPLTLVPPPPDNSRLVPTATAGKPLTPLSGGPLPLSPVSATRPANSLPPPLGVSAPTSTAAVGDFGLPPTLAPLATPPTPASPAALPTNLLPAPTAGTPRPTAATAPTVPTAPALSSATGVPLTLVPLTPLPTVTGVLTAGPTAAPAGTADPAAAASATPTRVLPRTPPALTTVPATPPPPPVSGHPTLSAHCGAQRNAESVADWPAAPSPAAGDNADSYTVADGAPVGDPCSCRQCHACAACTVANSPA